MHWSTCLVYLDDIIIYSSTIEDHFTRLQQVFERLRSAGLKMKPSKCYFFKHTIKYLGYVLTESGIQTDPDKTNCIKQWPAPTNATELKQFLGLATYYRKFVKNFSIIASPLHTLTRKNVQWEWTLNCQQAFQELKDLLTETPVLAFPSFTHQFILDTDASNDGLGAVLSQHIDGHELVVAYASRILSKSERSYCTTRKEMLALVWAVRYFRPYLIGREFRVRTDHNSLRWLQNFKDAEGQVARWLEVLAEFHMDVEHRPGCQHGNADALSRRCQQCHHQPSVSHTVAIIQETATASSWAPHWTIHELQVKQMDDPHLSIVINWLKSDSVPVEFSRQEGFVVQSLWNQRDSLVLYENVLHRRWEDVPNGGRDPRLQLVVPTKLVSCILEALHDHPTGGHLGIAKTLKKVQYRFYWPGQRKMVETWCKSCERCTRRKSLPKPHRAPLQSDTSGLPMQRIAMDIIGPLPETEQQNKYILVIADYFTKWTESFPMKNMEAKTIADILVNKFICRFGAPDYIHTDQGRNFESSLISEVCGLLGITKTRTLQKQELPPTIHNQMA